MTTRACDIAVVGGGVVGAAAALGLHRAGFDVRLIERGAPPVAHGDEVDARVYAMSPASARWLRELGVWQAMRPERLGAYESMRIWESRPERALGFDAADIGQSALGWIVEQSQLLAALWPALPAALVQTGSAVGAADIGDDGARLQLADGSSLSARIVLAAEGALSPLRERSGIATVEREYEQCALVAHLRCSQPHGGVALQRFLPGGPLALLPLADGRRSLVWSLPPDEAETLRTMPAAEFHQALASAIQFQAGVIEDSTPRLSFALRLLHAQDYVQGALVLVGDSAHVVHPLAGQGVNLGLGDAAALVGALTTARDAGQDWAAARVLRRYERARKAENLEMLALTDALDRAFRASSLALPRVLDVGLAVLDRVDPIKRLLIRRAVG